MNIIQNGNWLNVDWNAQCELTASDLDSLRHFALRTKSVIPYAVIILSYHLLNLLALIMNCWCQKAFIKTYPRFWSHVARIPMNSQWIGLRTVSFNPPYRVHWLAICWTLFFIWRAEKWFSDGRLFVGLSMSHSGPTSSARPTPSVIGYAANMGPSQFEFIGDFGFQTAGRTDVIFLRTSLPLLF